MKTKPVDIRNLIILAIAVVIVVAGAIYVTNRPDGNVESVSERSLDNPYRGALAPLAQGQIAALYVVEETTDRTRLAFADQADSRKSVADWEGRVVLLNLWATWCAPCREEMPALERLQETLGSDEFEVVAINVDRGGGAKGRAFYDEVGLDGLGFYYDDTQPGLVRELAIIGMPTTILIDRQGREIARMAGPAEWSSDDAIRLIEATIATTRTPG